MSWKDISKSSYTVESVKFTLPSTRPFTIPHQGPKVVYSEGDELTSVGDYRFNLDFTGIPLGPDHFPCGYWHKNYIPPITTIYTSVTYPLEVIESCIAYCELNGGNFKSILKSYSIPFESVTSSINLVDGIFKSIVSNYPYWPSEAVIPTSITLIEGVFKLVLHSYTYWPAEALGNCEIELDGGVFKKVLITYTYWPSESLEAAITITGGSHATA